MKLSNPARALPGKRKTFRGFCRAAALCALPAAISAQNSPPPPAPVVVPAPARFVVVLDAAHGGDDTGGHLSTGDSEKSVTLAFSVRLRSLLSARGIGVVTTREEDKTLSPTERAEIANRAGAGACISLHASESGSGVHIFVSSLPSTSGGKFTAWKTAQSAVVDRSLALAGELNSALNHAGVNVTLSRTTLPGIDSMTCPAVAIELAPQRDAGHAIVAEPANGEYQAQIAQTIATALLDWKTSSGKTEARQP